MAGEKLLEDPQVVVADILDSVVDVRVIEGEEEVSEDVMLAEMAALEALDAEVLEEPGLHGGVVRHLDEDL